MRGWIKNRVEANNNNQGTNKLKSCGNLVTINAPVMLPAILGGIRIKSQVFIPVRCDLLPHAPASEPGNRPTVLVVFAITSVPRENTRAGKVSKVPPPAMELTKPAARAASAHIRYSNQCSKAKLVLNCYSQ